MERAEGLESLMLSYVDTSALIALAVPSDGNHAPAVAFLRRSAQEGRRFVVGRPVLIEYIDGVTKRVGKREAIEELHLLERSTLMRVEPDVEEDHVRARELFFRYDDQMIDMTDALSFAIMERLGLQEAFAFDADFDVHGLVRKPRGSER